jgi:hypothetical protein
VSLLLLCVAALAVALPCAYIWASDIRGAGAG